ncbi:dihydrolipoamide acetyltransferase component of pyruvate dehydrogenase [Aspergillus piperis CBS 112811]|uniref:dihydrolipoyllysine-residue succinyltransferase n=1 Tax=Aspergillus piperis CBS 112811 TaxID=1448313 RepID=A0A8G1VGW8_9EURO|nr:dihydrolipoamide acetyltransferase component of pyruvate dehydrogenase [Aspergillus piperis CBS 112811]RAH52040.1 dihydrolipoamide acetyltransferase component of pyruvate dehydrogenase [Aspergillus piperis CBS 112811]
MLSRTTPRLRGPIARIPRAISTTPTVHSIHTYNALRLTLRTTVASQKSWIPIQSSQQQRTFSISALRTAETRVINVPAMAESISEGVLSTFHKQVGDYVEQDEEIASIETDKIDVAINASESGTIAKLLVNEGDTVTVGQAVIELSPEKRDGSQSAEVQPATEAAKESQEDQPASSPTSQPETKPEPKKESTAPPAPSKPAAPVASAQGPVSAYKGSRAERREKMTRMRLRTAERLKQSQNTAAFLTTFNEVDMSKVMEFRAQNKDNVLQKHGVKLGFMGPVARASALALKEIPVINASIENDDTIVFRDYIDLSVAVATPKGLVTPVLRNMESLSVMGIEKGIAELGKKARDGKLTMDDLSGGSFTISNSGIWGSLFGTPIINVPQTVVLGIYGIQQRPVAIKEQVEIRPMMYTALTYDHRLVDGREAVTFLTLVKKYLEDPASMLIE